MRDLFTKIEITILTCLATASRLQYALVISIMTWQ